MSKKNEYHDIQGNIYQDDKFSNQMKKQIDKNTNIYKTPTNEELKIAINNLKEYSELPENLHNEYANSEFINNLCEYYEYLVKRYNMILKNKKVKNN